MVGKTGPVGHRRPEGPTHSPPVDRTGTKKAPYEIEGACAPTG